MRIAFLVAVFLITAYCLVSAAKPAFFIKTMDAPTAQQIILQLGSPLRQNLSSDQSQMELVYRSGGMKPFCVEYLLKFNPNGGLTDWTWWLCD